MTENERINKSEMPNRIERRQADIVDLVKSILVRKQWTQKRLAEKMEKDSSYLSRILSGELNLTLKTILELEDSLGTNLLRNDLNDEVSDYLGQDFVKFSFIPRDSFGKDNIVTGNPAGDFFFLN